MRYHPRHALARAVRALSPKARAAVAVGAAVAATAGGLAATGTSGAATPAYTVGANNISMGQQFTGLCLDDYQRKTSPGTPAVIWACSATDPAQQWYWASDGTVHLGSTTGPALGVNQNYAVELTTSNDHWLPLGDWGVLNTDLSTPAGSNSDVGPSLLTLNDPGYSTAQGAQQIVYQRAGAPTANAQYNMPGTTYAATTFTDWPDARAAKGNTWALDNFTRYAAATSLGGGNYRASIADDYGTFLTVPGPTPAGGATISNVVKGSFNGTSGYTFTASNPPSASNVPKTMWGGTPSDRSCTTTQCPFLFWYYLFFPPGTSFTGSGADGPTGPTTWAWTYTACGGYPPGTNTWEYALANTSGTQSGDGDISGGC